ERVQISSATLIEPDVGPIPTLYVVSEPMLPELVIYEHSAWVICIGSSIVQRRIGQRRGTHIFHAAEYEVGHRHLGILLIGIPYPRGFREEVEHVGCEVERAPRRGFIDGVGHVIVDRGGPEV